MNNRKYQSFVPIYLKKLKMKNSFKPEENDNNNGRTDSSESGVDFLSIHCVIQTVTCLEDIKAPNCKDCDNDDNSNSKNWWECNCKNIEMSGRVVVPENTSINNFVKTVLVKLGYPSGSSSHAFGSILIRNWKPLPLKTICPGMNKSVGDILGELTALVSLRIQIIRPKITIVDTIKDNLLNFLIRTNQNFLIDSGCPLDTNTLLKLCSPLDYSSNKQYVHPPSEEVKKKFDSWLKFYEEAKKEYDITRNQKNDVCNFSLNNNNNNNVNKTINSNGNSVSLTNGSSDIASQSAQVQSDSPLKNFEETSKDKNANVNKETTVQTLLKNPIEKSKNSTVIKTRIRTSFDPEMELPKLHKWYLENPHPSRHQIFEYVTVLNSLESRKGRKQLDINNVLYWFKNARAAQKRTECRKITNPVLNGNSNKNANILKIPLGRTSAANSDDQRSVSDDDASITSESPEDYRNRSLQVVGKWNSNGQGEAVLEMQIESHKSAFLHSNISIKQKEISENEETSKSASLSDEDDTNDQPVVKPHSPDKNLTTQQTAENSIKNIKQTNHKENNGREENGFCNEETKELNNQNSATTTTDVIKEEVNNTKLKIFNRISTYKEKNYGNDSKLLSLYKSGFTTSSNIFEQSLMCMSQYMNPKLNNLSADEKRKRNRTFIDPVTEVPRLEEWFRLSTHPSHSLIARYTEELNGMPYRSKFPKLEVKNVQFWFKNRRAKNKRLNYIEGGNKKN